MPEVSRRSLIQTALAFSLSPALPSLASPVQGQRTTPSSPSQVDYVFDSLSGSFVPPSAMDSLMRRDAGSRFDRCIVAAEIHDNEFTHSAQLAVLDSARRIQDNRHIVVGLEQFYRAHDVFLDAYVNSRISLKEMLQQTSWDAVWGFNPEYYRPIFEYCRLHQIPMRGINVPQPVVSKVVEVGLENLPAAYHAFVPTSMDLSNKAHYAHFCQMMMDSGHAHMLDDVSLRRYYEVVVLWDEFMSESVSISLTKNPNVRMVAMIGAGHVEGRSGFPDRIQKRCQERPYTVVPRPVNWTTDEEYVMPKIAQPEVGVADLVWYTRRT